MPKPPSPQFAIRELFGDIGRIQSTKRFYVRDTPGAFQPVGYVVSIRQWGFSAGDPITIRYVTDEELRAVGWIG